jgi:hypothetical protein
MIHSIIQQRHSDTVADIEFSGEQLSLDLQISQLASTVKQLLKSYQEVSSSQPLAATPNQASSTQVERFDKPILPMLLRGEKL